MKICVLVPKSGSDGTSNEIFEFSDSKKVKHPLRGFDTHSPEKSILFIF